MKNKKKIVLLLVAVLTALTIFYLRELISFNKAGKDISQIRNNPIAITINGHVVHAELADTPAKKTKGLGGRESLTDSEGMLFDLRGDRNIPVFWMKGMLIPIDMIWIQDATVVQIDKNARPEPEVMDFNLTLYSPNNHADYVLEVRGSWSDTYAVEIGDQVQIDGF